MVRLGYILYGLLTFASIVYALYAVGGIALYAGGHFRKAIRPSAPLKFAAHMAAIAIGCFAIGRAFRFILTGA